jgi:hypothetical protein
MARQRATRQGRHSGRTWPTYRNKSSSEPSSLDGVAHTIARGDDEAKPKTDSCARHFSAWRQPDYLHDYPWLRACGAPYARERAQRWITGIQSAENQPRARSQDARSRLGIARNVRGS